MQLTRRTLPMLVALSLLPPAMAAPRAQAPPPAAPEVVARVGSEVITMSDVDARWAADDPGEFRRAQADLYASRRRVLEQLIADRLLRAEAAVRGTSTVALVAVEAAKRARPVTEGDVSGFLTSNPLPAGVPVADGRAMVAALLRRRAADDARQAYLHDLVTSGPVEIRLVPPRSHPGRAGHSPVRGAADAPIELVVFSDFECPFCRRADPVFERVLTRFAGRIRLVWRHYPLSIHAGARPAAVAAQCAHAQGRFWSFHDRLLAGGLEGEPAGTDLRSAARAVQLDLQRFDACVASDEATRQVSDDLRAGDAAGVTGTPTVFVNGVAVVGAQPFEVYEQVVLDELRSLGVADVSHVRAQ